MSAVNLLGDCCGVQIRKKIEEEYFPSAPPSDFEMHVVDVLPSPAAEMSSEAAGGCFGPTWSHRSESRVRIGAVSSSTAVSLVCTRAYGFSRIILLRP